MSLKGFLQQQDLYDQAVNDLPLLHGADLLETFLDIYTQVENLHTPAETKRIIGPRASLQFLHEHCNPYEVSRVLLTLKPDAYTSKTLTHLLESTEEDNKHYEQALYITALYYIRALEAGMLDDDTTYDIIDYLDQALSFNPVSDPMRLPNSISDTDYIAASRYYALQGDVYMKQKQRGPAIGAYDYAQHLQPEGFTQINPKANVILTYQRSMALWYIGQHEDSLRLLHEIIQSLGFFEGEDNDAIDIDKEFTLEDISLSVQYKMQFLLVALDMDEPDYPYILAELEDIEEIIDDYSLASPVKEFYYFCRGLYHAAPELEGEDADTALEYFQGIPVHPPGPFRKHINRWIRTGKNKKINLVPTNDRSIRPPTSD